MKAPLDNAIADAELTTQDIEVVIMVGGSSRIKAVQEYVKNYFGRHDILNFTGNPDEAISRGACILAGIKSGAEDLSKFNF